MEYFIASMIIAVVGWFVLDQILRRHKYDKINAVNSGMEYPNNHHVMGVGYYHAASQTWYPQPWNEYREGRGYYWNGTWNTAADHLCEERVRPVRCRAVRQAAGLGIALISFCSSAANQPLAGSPGHFLESGA